MTFSKSFTAGVLIGFGVIINLNMQPPILGALLFSFGLLTIIQLQLPLYTGKIGYVLKERNELPVILFANIFGISMLIAIYLLAHIDFVNVLRTAADEKFQKTFIQMFVDGILCGALIHFAVKCKQQIITIMAVIIFILVGAEHCIADFPYLLTVPSGINLVKYIVIILGNSIGAVIIEGISNGTYDSK